MHAPRFPGRDMETFFSGLVSTPHQYPDWPHDENSNQQSTSGHFFHPFSVPIIRRIASYISVAKYWSQLSVDPLIYVGGPRVPSLLLHRLTSTCINTPLPLCIQWSRRTLPCLDVFTMLRGLGKHHPGASSDRSCSQKQLASDLDAPLRWSLSCS